MMDFYIEGEDGPTLLPIREATITFRLEGDVVDRITHWIEGSDPITLRPFDRDRMLREEFGE